MNQLQGIRKASGWAALLLLVSPTALARTGERSFAPTGLRYSIMQISIQPDGGIEETLYRCPSDASADCLVDLTDPTALAQITDAAANVEVPIGEYLSLAIDTCPRQSSGDNRAALFVKGSATTGTDGGTTYYTNATSVGGVSTTGPAAFTSIENWFCSTTTVFFPRPIAITTDGGTTLTLRVDLNDVLMTSPNVSPGQGGCKAPDGGGQGICLSRIPLFAYIGNANVSIEKYYIAHHISDAGGLTVNEANGIVYLAIDPNDYPLMAFLGPYFSETSPAQSQATVQDPVYGGPGYMTDIYGTAYFVLNDGGAVQFQSGGPPTSDAGVGNEVGFSNFLRTNHAGQLNTRGTTNAWHYRAFKQ